MRTGFHRSHAALLVAGLVLLACDPMPASDATAPRRAPMAAGARTDASDVQQSATGHYQYFGFVTGHDFDYSFSAIRHADGSVSGQVEEYVQVAATGEFLRRSHGPVTCLTIQRNTARIAYRLEQYEGLPVLPAANTHGIIEVVDNGEGPDAVPDSAANNPGGVTEARAQEFCDVGFARPMRQIERGNIQVRP